MAQLAGLGLGEEAVEQGEGAVGNGRQRLASDVDRYLQLAVGAVTGRGLVGHPQTHEGAARTGLDGHHVLGLQELLHGGQIRRATDEQQVAVVDVVRRGLRAGAGGDGLDGQGVAVEEGVGHGDPRRRQGRAMWATLSYSTLVASR